MKSSALLLSFVLLSCGVLEPSRFVPPDISFTQVKYRLQSSCASRVMCHGDSLPVPQLRPLVLLVDSSYAALVERESVEVPSMLLVAPGKPERSYLMWKLVWNDSARGDKMPPDFNLEPWEIEWVRWWILAGAEDD